MASQMTPTQYRPTLLKRASKHCAATVTYYGAEEDRRMFHPGTAAHAVLQAVSEAVVKADSQLDPEAFEKIADTVARRLMSEGRTFDGRPEPPLPPDAVWKGVGIARRYHQREPILPIGLNGSIAAEIGLAVDADWKLTPYDGDDVRLRAILDVLLTYDEMDEEGCARVVHVRDYKSAWPTDASELDTLQLKAQAVLAWLRHGDDVDIVRQEVINLQTCASYTRDLWISGDGIDTLKRWQRELTSTMDSLDALRRPDGTFPEAPGGGCISCPHVLTCEAGASWIDETIGLRTPKERAAEYLKAKAVAERLGGRDGILREDAAEYPIEVPGGVVGTVGRDGRAPIWDAGLVIWEWWQNKGGDAATLLAALKPGVEQVKAFARLMRPDRDQKPERDDIVERLTAPTVRRCFGFHKHEEED